MNMLPWLFYLMQTLPIHLPPSFLPIYKRCCSAILFKDLPLIFKYSRLTPPKHKGGVSLPDLNKYFLACQLTRKVSWDIHNEREARVHLENYFSQLPLKSLPWIFSHTLPKQALLLSFISHSIQCFHKAYDKTSLFSSRAHWPLSRWTGLCPMVWQVNFQYIFGLIERSSPRTSSLKAIFYAMWW